MFIKYIELENYNNIHTGLNTNRLRIDFSKQKNPVCIVSGPNGIGKTSLISCMTPFASIGNIDSRDSNSLILPKQPGYKKIVFVDGNNEYEIEHLYTPKEKGHTVKSYFKRNGEELNENGNVTSFKKLVAEFMDIEIDFLKLIRIGDNVQNIIRSKPAERKTFMGKILDETDIYLHYYKIITQKQRDLKTVLGHLIDELNKTEISDESEASTAIKSLDSAINSIQLQIEKDSEALGKLNGKIELIDFPTDGDLIIRDLSKKVDKYEKSLSDNPFSNSEAVKAEIDRLTEIITSVEKDLAVIQVKREKAMEESDNLCNESLKITNDLNKEKQNLNLESLKTHLIDLQIKIHEVHREVFEHPRINVSKEDFEEFVVFLKNTQKYLNKTYEFGLAAVKEVLKQIKANKDVDNIIRASLVYIEHAENKRRMNLVDKLIDKYAMNVDCDRSCPYKMLQKELMAIRDEEPVSEVKFTSEFYEMMKHANDNLKEILDSISSRRDFIKQLPDDIQAFFITDILFKKIGAGDIIYNEKILNEYLSELTDLAAYEKLNEDFKKTKQEIEVAENSSIISYLEKRAYEIDCKLAEISEDVNHYLEEDRCKKEELGKLNNEIDVLSDLLEAMTSKESVSNELNDLNSRRHQYIEALSARRDLELILERRRVEQANLIKDRYRKESNLLRYRELCKEIAAKQKKYERNEHIKYAVSNTEGIPLVYIDMYLRDTREIANKLLDVIFDGNIYLNKFDINADEFKMPYVKNGKVIDDVSTASQGEESFFNMAISSALRSQAMQRYNVALFDEVDSMFDDNNRQRFIPLLELLMDMNNVEQAFLITHNQMFQKYPVDVIDLATPSHSTVDVILG